MNIYKKLLGQSLAGISLLTVALVSSQAAAQEGSESSAGRLEEVVVVARRRAENLQNVPVAVQAFGTEYLERANINNFSEIASRTPGMVFSQSNGVDQEVFIRGIGTDIQGAAVDNPVGIFVDGVFMSRNSGTMLGLYDLERVEVLKGPQSLRFGKNIVGGLVHYVTKKPTDSFEGNVELSYGDYDTVNVAGSVRGPISDTVSYSFSAMSNEHDGYGENTIGEDADDEDMSAVRAHLNFDVSDATSVLVSADYNKNRSAGTWVDVAEAGDSEAVTFNGFFAPPIPELPGFVLPNRNEPFKNSDPRKGPRNLVGWNNSDIYGGSVTVTHEGDNGFSLTSITALRETKVDTLNDGCGMYWNHPFTQAPDGLTIPDPAAAIVDSLDTYLTTVPDCWFEQIKTDDADQLSQELRLSWDRGNAVWSAGLYYLDEDISRSETVAFSFPDFNVITDWSFSLAFGGAPSGLVETAGTSFATTTAKATNIGVFGEVDYELSDKMSLNIGLRWVRDEKDFGVTRSGDSFDEQICEPDDGGMLPPGCEVAGEFTTGDSDKWDEILPSISLRYSPNDELTYYARYEKGYKPGGYTGEGAGQPTSAVVSFDPEFANAFEIGGKLLLADRRVRLNIAAYFTDYEDLQTSQFIAADPTRPPDNFIVNATDGTEAYGVEVDFEAAISDAFTLFGNYAFTRCEFAGELIIDDDGTDIDGNTCRRTPEHGYNLGAQYQVPVGNNYQFSLGGDYQWKDEYFFNNENDPIEEVDSESMLNLYAGVSSLDNDWDLQFWMKNVTDELNTANVFVLFGTKYLNYTAPRTYGLTFRKQF